MSGGRIESCGGLHAEDATPVATGYVRYVHQRGGAEILSEPLCDRHQAEWCTALRAAERHGLIREVGAVPLDHRERMAQARNAGKVRPGRITDEQVRAYRMAYYAQMHAGTAGPDQGNAIRAGLAAAYVQRETERREIPE